MADLYASMQYGQNWNPDVDRKSVFVQACLSVGLPLLVIAIVVAANRSAANPAEAARTSSQYELYPDRSTASYWASEVIKGGYFLHVRHTQREKWTDVTAFDALELSRRLDASNETFARATCLTDRGIEEAKMIGAVFEDVGVEIAKVISSPSCRARQTARFAFGSEGTIANSLLHRTAIKQSQHHEFAESLRNLMLNIETVPGANVVLSGHGGTLGYDADALIDENRIPGKLDDRDEGGFIVLENVDGQLIAHHKFKTFSEFANEAIVLPIKAQVSMAASHDK